MTDPADRGGIDLDGARIVITGAGSGIGAALAERFAVAGARLVLSDREPAPVAAVAERVGGVSVACDVGVQPDVDRLVEVATATLGGIDVFCANAGIAPAGSLDPVAWQEGWEINVLSHLYAVRALLPGWLAAGRGRLVVTVSAAGLLTMLDNAAYAVTKHAALAFAEWVQVTYAHRGITVQALCPQGVRTPMLAAAGPRGQMLMGAGAMAPEDVAQTVVDALGTDRFLILPHADVAEHMAKRAGDLDRWLASMNRLQQRMEVMDPGPAA